MDRYRDDFQSRAEPDGLGGLILSIVSMALVAILSRLAFLVAGGDVPVRTDQHGLMPEQFIILALCSAAGFLAVSGILLCLFRGPIRLTLRRRDAWPVAGAATAVLLANLAGTTLGDLAGEPYAGGPDMSRGGPAVAGIFLVAVILAPMVEELFFRELLLTRVMAGTPRAVAISVTAVGFGVFHVTAGGIILAGTLAFMGAVFAWIRLRTGSVAASFLVHAINNGVALLFLIPT
jgi:membrane protease YdiL (CAAX protease family)